MTRSRLIPVLLALASMLSVFTTSCRQSYTVIPADQLVKMPAFRARVERVDVQTFESSEFGTIASVGLKTDDGRRVAIGGEKASPEMIGFVQSLQEGKTYTFPDVFVAYQKSREEKK